MCINHRVPNTITTRDDYPWAYIEDLIDWLHGSSTFTKFNLASGYHQLRIHRDARHKTTFVTFNGVYEWMVIWFGLANMLSAFMHAIHCILGLYKVNPIV